MDYYEDNNTIKKANDIVFRDKAKQIASKSFTTGSERGHEEGVKSGESSALDNMQKLANMKAAFDRVQRTPQGLSINEDDAALASDFMLLKQRQIQQEATEAPPSGLGGGQMNRGAQDFMLGEMGGMQHNDASPNLIPVPRQPVMAPKAKPTQTTLRAMQIAEEALRVGQQ